MALVDYTGATQAKAALLTNIKDAIQALDLTAAEVVTARDGEDDLTTKIQAVEGTVTTVTSEVETARGLEPTLTAKIQDIESDVDDLETEVIAARGTDIDLDARLDGFDTDIASLTNAELPGQAGNAGKFLTTDGTTASWGAVYFNWEAKTASFTASGNSQYLVDCSGGAVTVTFPASPTLGDEIVIKDSGGDAGTNNITIDGNGNSIEDEDSAETFVIATNKRGITFVFAGSTIGWVKTAEVYGPAIYE